LSADSYKEIIVHSLKYVTQAQIMDVFGFVIMPTHLHLIWRSMKLNGRETGRGSFLKYSAHEFWRRLYKEDRKKLMVYQVEANNKQHEF